MIDQKFIDKLWDEHEEAASCPPPHLVIRFFEGLMGLLFSEFSNKEFRLPEELGLYAQQLAIDFKHLLKRDKSLDKGQIDDITKSYFEQLADIKEQLHLDIEAMYQGDPAAKSTAEVIRTYPGFYAIAAHRLAHYLYGLDIQLMPRIISEHAHSKTGIDIHPGASIGESFCIDHGTGIVIGETTNIGNHVKIYQGVTLGALSVKKEDASNKRHPTIEDRVVIYAGSSILGGQTTIGHDSIIGGNVWLTKSVAPFSKIYYKASMTNTDGETDVITFKP